MMADGSPVSWKLVANITPSPPLSPRGQFVLSSPMHSLARSLSTCACGVISFYTATADHVKNSLEYLQSWLLADILKIFDDQRN